MTMESLKRNNQTLEGQLKDALEKLAASADSVVVKCNHEDVDNQLAVKVEQLEAELKMAKVELRLRQEDVNEEQDKLAVQLDSLRVSFLKF